MLLLRLVKHISKRADSAAKLRHVKKGPWGMQGLVTLRLTPSQCTCIVLQNNLARAARHGFGELGVLHLAQRTTFLGLGLSAQFKNTVICSSASMMNTVKSVILRISQMLA